MNFSPPKPGERRGGRKKGVPNKSTTEFRNILARIFDNKAGELEAMIDECRYGIEIEKTMPDGQTVVGRLNADPGKAADLMLKLAEFSFPKLGRMEHTGKDGEALEIVVLHETRKDD